MGFKARRREAGFVPWFPTQTKGDGRIRPNNARPGKEQPNAKPSPRRKVLCAQCGFPADLSIHASDGGSLEGSGAGGDFTAHSSDSNVKEQAYRPGAGCPFCFSKNFAKGGRTARP